MILDMLTSMVPGRSRFHQFVDANDRPVNGICLCSWCWGWRWDRARRWAVIKWLRLLLLLVLLHQAWQRWRR